jgi:hypothetical protein
MYFEKYSAKFKTLVMQALVLKARDLKALVLSINLAKNATVAYPI